MLLLDVDGVLTDGRIILDDRGVETKQFDVRDGQGIVLLMRAGIEVGLITARNSKAVRYRAKELGLRIVHQGIQSKATTYGEIRRQSGLAEMQIAYIGDDIGDLEILHRVGLAVTVNDGWEELFRFVDYITDKPGGRGAVREVAELLLKAQNKWNASAENTPNISSLR
ncbi:MAG TPA: HAD hydrolase family protein [Candidatus Binatia bacterium]|nr:HAD hydrolase family protein [Candidatus Binatia bacterium]